jgi:hypothetical protein
MPAQQLVLDVGLEVDDGGRFAYRDVTVTEPRQSGKTTKLLSLAVWRATVYARAYRAQRIAYSAQSGHDARRKMLDDWLPTLEHSGLFDLVRGIRRASGHEAFRFAGGSMIEPIANSAGSGHGKILDLCLLDEAFDDTDDRREQAMVPAMATRADAQLWITSTAGTAEALYLRRKVDTGRAGVEAGATNGSAYFEWSAADDDDLDDERTWPTFMPALGHTIGLDAVRHAHRTMTAAEFARAFGNRWTSTAAAIIPFAAWQACQAPDASPPGPLTLAVDCPPDRSSATIVACGLGPDGRPVVELIERRTGLGWAVERLDALVHSHDVRGVVLAGLGPAGTLVVDLERVLGPELYVATEADMTLAAGSTFDAIVEQTVAVRPSVLLDSAVAGARQRRRGDAFTWARRSMTVDLSPLVAMSLALWRATTEPAGPLWVFR